MSAYRNKPPPPRWRVVYRTPLLQRMGRGAVIGGFATLALVSVFAIAALLLFCGGEYDGAVVPVIGTFAAMTLLTAGMMLFVHFATSASEIAECKVGDLQINPGDPSQCLILSGSERWLLPLPIEALREGQALQVRYRDLTPESNAARGREILEIKVVDE
jgi:hypothetical protein